MSRGSLAAIIVVMSTTAPAHAAPIGLGVAAETSGRAYVDAAPTGFAGGDVFALWRVLPAFELSLRYQFSVMLPSLQRYPYGCAAPDCGMDDRRYRSDSLLLEVAGVPLHTRFVDIGAGIVFGGGIETIEDQPLSTWSRYGDLTKRVFHDSIFTIAAKANVDFRPMRWLGLRVSADVGWMTSEAGGLVGRIMVGPVVWFAR
jgi:hypothetical protein